MRALLYNEDERVRRFVAGLSGREPDFGPSTATGVLVDGELIAGIVYNEFRGYDLSMHVSASSPKWASRKIVGTLLAYPFAQLGCVRVTAMISATNDRARKLLRQLGFHVEGFHPLALYGREDALSFGMLRADAARWIGALRGQDAEQEFAERARAA